MEELLAALPLLFVAFQAFIEIQSQALHLFLATRIRRNLYERRLRLRRGVVLRLLARRESSQCLCDETDLLDSMMGDRPADQTTTTASNSDPELSTLDIEAEPQRPLVCSSPAPSCSSSSESESFYRCHCSSCTSSSSSQHTRSGKRKRDSSADLLEYLERSGQRFLEQSRRNQELTAAMVQSLQRMQDDVNAIVGLMRHMVSVLAKK